MPLQTKGWSMVMYIYETLQKQENASTTFHGSLYKNQQKCLHDDKCWFIFVIFFCHAFFSRFSLIYIHR